MVLSPDKRANIKVPGKVEQLPKKSPTGFCKIQKGSKPLRDKRFYLDLKNHSAATKLENTLRSLGAVVDPFIGQEVNIVVTDRPEWGSIVAQSAVGSPSCASSTSSLVKPTPSPLPCFFSPAASPAGHSRGSNISPAFDSPGETTGTIRRHSRSRAEAMLDRVRLQPQVKVRDPLTDAHKWNIPIYTLEKLLKFLEKIQQTISRGTGESVVNKNKRTKTSTCGQKVKFSSGKHFLKIEPVDRKCRPSFKDLSSWPKLNLDSDPGTSPFVSRHSLPKCAVKTVEGPATLKNKVGVLESKINSRLSTSANKTVNPSVEASNCKPAKEEFLSGYCEVCKLDYSDLFEHIKTPNHQEYSLNDKNYASLDAFVNTRSLNVNDYLNKSEDLSEDNCASSRPRLCSSEGPSFRPPRPRSPRPRSRSCFREDCVAASYSSSGTSSSPPATVGAHAESAAELESVNNGMMRQSVDDRHLATKMVGRKDSLEVHCNGLSNHVQTRFACSKGDRENLGGLFLDDRLPSAQLRRRRAISVSCRDLLQLSTATGNDHYLRSGRGTRSELSQLSPALSDNSHPLLNSNSQQPLLSPTLSEKSHHLRPRGQLWLSTGLLSEEEPLLSRGPNGKVSAPSLLVTANNCHLDKEDRVVERRSIRRKRLSAEEKLIEDNRGYYKVEVLNSKLRSTGYYVSQVAQSGAPPSSESSTQEDRVNSTSGGMKEPVVVRFKKIRRSELSVLSDEAENFMFGEQARSESNSDSSEFEEEEDEEESERVQPGEEGQQDEEGSGGKRGRPRRIRVKVDVPGEETSNSNGHRRHRKRRNTPNDWDPADVKDEWRPDMCSLDKLHFSFESIPRSEVWYQTFERQDRCEEVCFPIPYEPSSVLLPYQVPRQRSELPANRPPMQLKKRRYKSLVKLPRKSPRCHASTLAMLSSRLPPQDDSTTESVSSESHSRESHSRESLPRRGILHTQPVAAPTAEPFEIDPDMREIAKNVDSMLGIVEQPKVLVGKGRWKKKGSSENEKDPALNYLVDPDILEELACTCDVVANPLGGPSMDIVTLLDTYSNCNCVVSHDVDASCNSSECGASSICETDRRTRKKRKRRNMTGWDKPKKRSLRREVLTREGTPLSMTATIPSAAPSPAPADDSAPASEDGAAETVTKRRRKLVKRINSSVAFRKGRAGLKRIKLADKEGFRKRGRTLGWRKPR